MLVVRGASECLYNKQGVTQGDPLSVFMYSVGTSPLIRSLCVQLDRHRFDTLMMDLQGISCVIFMTGFPFSALEDWHMVTFQSLLRALLLLMSILF